MRGRVLSGKLIVVVAVLGTIAATVFALATRGELAANLAPRKPPAPYSAPFPRGSARSLGRMAGRPRPRPANGAPTGTLRASSTSTLR
ncbi:MAG: hypothetical protein ACYDH5_04585 [Acidimicrobiales bacterium]